MEPTSHHTSSDCLGCLCCSLSDCMSREVYLCFMLLKWSRLAMMRSLRGRGMKGWSMKGWSIIIIITLTATSNGESLHLDLTLSPPPPPPLRTPQNLAQIRPHPLTTYLIPVVGNLFSIGDRFTVSMVTLQHLMATSHTTHRPYHTSVHLLGTQGILERGHY